MSSISCLYILYMCLVKRSAGNSYICQFSPYYMGLKSHPRQTRTREVAFHQLFTVRGKGSLTSANIATRRAHKFKHYTPMYSIRMKWFCIWDNYLCGYIYIGGRDICLTRMMPYIIRISCVYRFTKPTNFLALWTMRARHTFQQYRLMEMATHSITYISRFQNHYMIGSSNL